MGKRSDDLVGIEARIEGNLDLQINLDIRITCMLSSLGARKREKPTSIAPSLNRP